MTSTYCAIKLIYIIFLNFYKFISLLYILLKAKWISPKSIFLFFNFFTSNIFHMSDLSYRRRRRSIDLRFAIYREGPGTRGSISIFREGWWIFWRIYALKTSRFSRPQSRYLDFELRSGIRDKQSENFALE